MTVMAEALRRAGFNKMEYALGMAILTFRKLGGTESRAVEIVRESYVADQKPGKGHKKDVINDDPCSVARPSRSFVDAKDQMANGGNTAQLIPVPHLHLHRGAEDHDPGDRKVHLRDVIPVREPSPVQLKSAIRSCR